MSLRRRKPDPPPVPSERLTGVRSHIHDEDDDRPSREDVKPQGSQVFKPDLPRFLKRKRER
jgi:hypothetical protein